MVVSIAPVINSKVVDIEEFPVHVFVRLVYIVNVVRAVIEMRSL